MNFISGGSPQGPPSRPARALEEFQDGSPEEFQEDNLREVLVSSHNSQTVSLQGSNYEFRKGSKRKALEMGTL